MRLKHRSLVVTCATVSLHFASPARADSFTWIGPSESEWFNPANWSGSGGVPDDATDDAFVNGGAPTNRIANVNGDLTLNALTISAGDTVRLLDTHAFRANLVQVDSGTFWALNQTMLRDTTFGTTGTGIVRVGNNQDGLPPVSASLQDLTLRARFNIGTNTTATMRGTFRNEGDGSAFHRLELSRGARASIDGAVRFVAEPGRTGLVLMSDNPNPIIDATAGSLTLSNQEIRGHGRLAGTIFNGDAFGSGTIIGALGITFEPGTTVVQTPTSTIGTTPDGHVTLRDGVTITGGRLIGPGSGFFVWQSSTVNLNNVTNEARFELGSGATAHLNGFINLGTLVIGRAAVNADAQSEFAHAVIEFGGAPGTFNYARPLVMESGGMLRVSDISAFTVNAGNDLVATNGGKLVALEQGAINGAPSRDVRVQSGGILYARDQARVSTSNGNIVAAAGGRVVVDGSAQLIAGGGFVRAEGTGVVAGRGTIINLQAQGGGSIRPGDALDDYLAANPTLSPAIGSLLVGGTMRFEDDASSLVIDVTPAPTPTSVSSDFITVVGHAALDGTLAVRLIGAAPVLPGNTFDVVAYTSRVGTFDQVLNQTGFAGLSFEPTYTPTKLTLTTHATPGDANLDARVNLNDFNILAANFGGAGNWLMADFNFDNVVNLDDFNLLAGNFGMTAHGPGVSPGDWAALAAAVPEPGAVVSIVVVMSVVARRRRSAASRLTSAGDLRATPDRFPECRASAEPSAAAGFYAKSLR